MSFIGGDLQEIPASPFKVKVDPSHDAGKVRAEGPGLNKTGEETKVATTSVALIIPNSGNLLNYSNSVVCKCQTVACRPKFGHIKPRMLFWCKIIFAKYEY